MIPGPVLHYKIQRSRAIHPVIYNRGFILKNEAPFVVILRFDRRISYSEVLDSAVKPQNDNSDFLSCIVLPT